jgi:type IV pilus assembly protein PilQ
MSFLKPLTKIFKKATALAMVIAIAALLAHAQQTTTPRPTPQKQSEQGQRYGTPGFVGEPINLNVVNADIRDILSYITEQYGVNFVIDKSVKGVPVTVNLSDVPWNVALEAILQANGLGVDVQGSILRIADAKIIADEVAVRRQIEESRLDVEPLYTEIIQLNYARAGGSLAGQAGSTGTFTGGGTGGTSTGGDASGTGLLPIIKRRLSRRGGIEIDERGNRLIITDVRRNIDSIRQLVALLDQPEPQVEVEVRVVVASRNFSRNLGVQLSGIINNPNNGAGGVISTFPGGDVNTTPTVPFPRGGGASFPSPSGGLGGAANTVIGLTTGIFGTARINLAISLAEQKNQAKTIATPRITTLNNRPAQVESGVQVPIVTAQTGANGGATVFTTSYVNVPLRLSVTPQITEAGTVILRVVAENNTVGTIAPGLAPPINTQRMQSEVTVPDGGTTVVGGALIDNEIETRDRTPGLASIPVLGNLFKRRGTQRDTSELLFFITPRIYRMDTQGRPLSGTVTDSTRSTTILQPVPLGNPPTNSTVPAINPVLPQTSPGVNVPILPQPQAPTQQQTVAPQPVAPTAPNQP